MSNVSTNNMLHLVVGTTGQPGSVPATPNLLGPGEVGAYAEDGTLADAGDRKFFIARGGDTPGKFMRTDVIDRDSRGETENYRAGAAASGQVDFIGYNGVSGAITMTADNMYYVRLYMQEFLGSASDARDVKHGVYQSTATPTQVEVAANVANSINLNLSRDPEQKIHATMVNSASTVASIAEVTVTNKSDVIVVSAGTGLAVGDFVKNGTTTTSSAMLITEVTSATSYRVSNVWHGPTSTTAGESFVAADAGDAGIKLEGLELDWSRGRISQSVVIFDTVLEDFGASAVTKSSAASKGIFTGKAVSDLETFAQGYYGEEYRMGEPALFAVDAYADSNLLYNGHRWNTVNDEVVGIGATPTSKKEFLVTLPQSETASAISVLLGVLGAPIA